MNMQNLMNRAKQQLTQTTIDKKKSIIATVLLSAVTMGASGVAMAGDHDRDDDHEGGKSRVESSVQYTGPVETATIQEVIAADSWFSDKDFTLEGKVVKQLTNSTFVFSDGTDEMTIKIKSHTAANFSDTDAVRISGEYESDMFEDPEFKVKKLTVL